MSTSTIGTPPPVAPAGAWRFPRPHERCLDNGLRVLCLDCPGQHVVSVAAVVDVALSAEPGPIEGVASLAAECLTQGAGGLDAEAFSDALAACGADMGASAGPDVFSVHLGVPSPRLERGLELLTMALAEPVLDPHEVGQRQRLRLQEIEQSLAYPTMVVGDRLNAEVFGSARLARPAGGSATSVAAIRRDDVAALAATWLDPRRTVLVVVGDGVSRLQTGMLERTVGRWRPGEREVSPVPDEVVQVGAGAVVLVDWPGAAQAVVRLAAPGITRADPRWAPLFVANHVLGGSFGSRLNTVLREQKGLTYGIGSGLDSSRTAGLLAIGASVRADAAAECVGEILSIVDAAHADGFTGDEIAGGVRAAVDSAPLGYERAEAVANRVEVLLAHRLPLDHVDTNLARMRTVTAAKAHEVYADVVDPGAFTVVVAADAESQAEPLRALGRGPVHVVERPRPPGPAC